MQKKYSLDVYLQLMNFGSQLDKRWLPQPTDRKTQNVRLDFTTELKFGVNVAETDPPHILRANRMHKILFKILLTSGNLLHLLAKHLMNRCTDFRQNHKVYFFFNQFKNLRTNETASWT